MSTHLMRISRIFPFSRRLFVSGAVLVVSLVLAAVFFYEVFAQPLSVESSAPASAAVPLGTVYLSGSGQSAAVAAQTEKAQTREIHIANNGLTLLRGATVVSNALATIRVSTALGLADFTWVVKTNSKTKFFTSIGEKGSPADIQVGDVLTVTGILTEGGAEPTIEAGFVRE